jgi:hypothetical protein
MALSTGSDRQRLDKNGPHFGLFLVERIHKLFVRSFVCEWRDYSDTETLTAVLRN